MSAPWLSDLSEDWKTPSSTHSSSLPVPRTSATAASTTSRIPRATQRLATPAPTRTKPLSNPANSKRTLSERSYSDINIPSHSSPAQRHVLAKSTGSRQSRSSSASASSAGSVVRLNTAARKARSSSPTKSNSKTGTPEWRKIVMKGQSNPAQANLFSPNRTGLESIFQKPQSAPNEGTSKPRPSFSFLQDLESMPSSPPPWPKGHRPSRLSLDQSSNLHDRESLGVLEEHEEADVPNSLDQASDDPVESANTNERASNAVAPPASLEYKTASSEFPTGVDGSSDMPQEAQGMEDHISNPNQEVSDPDLNGPPMRSTLRKASSSINANTSSVGGGFSPVFISKHNGADGRIGYAAVDLSNPEMLERLRESHGFHVSSVNQSKTAHADRTASEDIPSFVESNNTANNQNGNTWNRHSLTHMGEFVSMARGGRSDEGSFMHRPLSPSQSSSIVPSDSISQVGTQSRPQKSILAPGFQDNSQMIPLSRSQNYDRLTTSIDAGVDTNQDQVTDLPDHVSEPQSVNFSHDTAPSAGSVADGSVETVLGHPISYAKNPDDPTNIDSAESLRLSSSSSPQSEPFALDSDKFLERPSTPQRTRGDITETSPTKRSAPYSSKIPTPKRLRTLSELEHVAHQERTSTVVEEQHRQMQAIIGKRKDARYDDYHQPCDPEALAKRAILRPRNLTLAQQEFLAESEESFNESLESNLTLKTVQEHIEQANLDCNADDEAKIKALATEVATLRLHGLQSMQGEVRKQSVSTQDYVDEAMKIMELIRSKRLPHEALSSLEEMGSDAIAPVDNMTAQELTPETISRPPSREGAANAWRSRHDHPLNSEVESQLQRYQEVEDESFMATSAFGDLPSPSVSHHVEDEQTPVDEESADIRILGHFQHGKEPVEDNQHGPTNEFPPPQSPAKTYGSNKSTDSSGRTVETTSTLKTRTLPVIAPGTVSHLLRAEEAGMRFDAERQTWVKCKNAMGRLDPLGNLSSSTGTEDDPFGAISDLSIDDAEVKEERERNRDKYIPHFDSSELRMLDDADPDDEGQREDHSQYTLERPVQELGLPKEKLVSRKISQDGDETREAADRDNPHQARSATDDDTEDVPMIPDDAATSLERLAKVPTGSILNKRRDVSVLFSSPPVSKQYAAQRWSDPSEQSDPDQSVLVHRGGRAVNNSETQLKSRAFAKQSPNSLQKQQGFTPINRELNLSCIDEHHEISIIGTRADGRSMSLSLSVSTPLPSHRHSSRPIIQSSGLRNSSLWNSLSPLSEFSFHQDDIHHRQARLISGGENQQLVIPRRANNAAVVVETLVQTLTDVEPDEPYWDFMRALHLARKDLNTLHTLDEFCPRIEELDVSENALQHLNGAPPSIRQLDARQNSLSSLSSWEHLVNLQYLDISANGIESFEGLSNLVHLRELIADDNNVHSLEGLLDLDGLISLSIKRNKLECLDFQGAEMKRLSTLNVENNILESVRNIHSLLSLRHLDLSDNKLSCFSCQELSVQGRQKLQTLRIANNQLDTLDVACFTDLQTLDVDGNRLTRIDHIKNLHLLCSLFARSQKPVVRDQAAGMGEHLEDFSEIRHLYLSGNFIPHPEFRTPFLNMQTLELASAGVQALPKEFGTLVPNLRVVNLNANALKDLRPLQNIQKLKNVMVAGNRLSRLRKTVKVFATLPSLQEVDVRDNPLTLGYYPLLGSGPNKLYNEVMKFDQSEEFKSECHERPLKHVLPPVSVSDDDREEEKSYVERLDEDTRLRRRLYELLLAAKCPKLESVDGRQFLREMAFRVDDAWEQLVELGIVERADGGEY